jgi:hypothetical protein
VAADFLERRLRDGDASIEAVLQEHPELLPELTQELRKAQQVQQVLATDVSSSASGSIDALGSAGSTRDGHFVVRCPHCHSPTHVPAGQSLAHLSCGNCGSDFHLIDEPAEDPGAGPKRMGHFELLERIGAGGFGVVWKGYDTQLQRLVAVKLPRRDHLNPDEQEQFLREAQSAAQLKHPHIVPVYEVGREGETL